MQTLNFPLVVSSIVAIFLHLALFSLLILSSSFPAAIPQKKLLVSTVRLNPEKKTNPTSIPASSVSSVKKETPMEEKQEPLPPQKKETAVEKKEAIPQQKKEPVPITKPAKKKKKESVKDSSKKEAPKKTAVKEPPPAKPASDQKKNALLAKAQESLKKIGNVEGAKVPHQVATLAPLQSLELITTESMDENEIAYRDELAQLLKAHLRLPELGEINLKLTIAKNGAIKTIEILSSESLSNRKYVEKTLPQHTMPPLGKQFGKVDSYTFTITMKGV